MNKIILILIAFFICQTSLFSQETENRAKYQTNELKINLFNTFVFAYPELNYERVFSGNYGIGMSAAVKLFGKYTCSFHVLPYGRVYFFESQKIATFFIEVNMGYVEYNRAKDYNIYNGLVRGMAGGFKFFFKEGVGEIFIGCGSNFGEYRFYYPRAGITLGFGI